MRLIDADALKRKWLFRGNDGRPYRDEIDSMPTIDAVPVRHGEWIGVSPMVDTRQCSRCGYNIVSEELETPYCPWCGARMDGERRNG